MKHPSTFLLALTLALPAFAVAGQLDGWLAEAVANSPALAASQYAADAASEGATSRRAWDPPQVAVELFQSPVAGFPNPFYQQEEVDWSVQQMIPFPGKTGAMARSETLRNGMLLSEKRARRNRLVRQFKETYWDLWSIEERLRLDAERIRNLSEFADVARLQLESGMGTQAQVLRARSELASLRVDSANLSRERASMQAMLQSLMGRPGGAPLDSIEQPTLPAPAPLPDPAALDSARPDLVGMEYSARMNEAMADASKRELLPDFMVRGMYKQMVGMDRDYWSLMVGVTVPVAPWSVAGPAATARQRTLEARRDRMEARTMRNMAIAEAQAARNDLDAALASVKASDSILIPQSELAWKSASAAYRNGREEFLMVLDTWKMALMAREERIMGAMKALRSQAVLEEALGGDDAGSTDARNGGNR